MSKPSAAPTVDPYHVPALARGLQLLGLFSATERTLTGADIARHLDLPRASVFRLLYTLEKSGFVERTGTGNAYALGVGVLRLGFEYLASQDLTELAAPAVDALRDATGMTAHLVLRDHTEAVFVLKSISPSALYQSIKVGARLPCHATALGRCLLSGLNATKLQALFANHALPAFTPRTPTTLEALHALIAADAAQGYSVSEGGYEAGISTIAAPVHNAIGEVCAAISITVPASQIDAAMKPRLIQSVKQAAHELSQRLSHIHSSKH